MIGVFEGGDIFPHDGPETAALWLRSNYSLWCGRLGGETAPPAGILGGGSAAGVLPT